MVVGGNPPGVRLDEWRRRQNGKRGHPPLAKADLAYLLGTTAPTLERILSGETLPSLEVACEVERITGGEIACLEWCPTARNGPPVPLGDPGYGRTVERGDRPARPRARGARVGA